MELVVEPGVILFSVCFQGFVDAALTVPKDLEGAFDGPYKDYQVNCSE